MTIKQATLDRQERRKRQLICEYISEKEAISKTVVRHCIPHTFEFTKKMHRYVDILRENDLDYLEAKYDDMVPHLPFGVVNILCTARNMAGAESHADDVMNRNRVKHDKIPISKECSEYMKEFLKFDCGELSSASTSRYPFSELEFGQSFWQRFDEGNESSLRSYVTQWNKRGRKQFKFLKLGMFETFEVGRTA